MMHRSKCFFNWGNVPESHSLQQELISRFGKKSIITTLEN